MAHLASIDLEELAETNPDTGFPLSGALVFFAGDRGHAIRYAPDPTQRRSSEAEREGRAGSRHPEWPVVLLPLPDGDATAIDEAVERIAGPPKKHRPSTLELSEYLPRGSEPWLWDTALRLRDALQAAPDRKRGLEAEFPDQASGFFELVENLSSECAGKDPLQPLSDRDAQVLADIYGNLDPHKTPESSFGRMFQTVVGYGTSLSDFTDQTVFALVSGPPEAFIQLPDAAQEHIRAHWRRPNGQYGIHQMFGEGLDFQDQNELLADKHMVLQLCYDTLVGFRFGDIGALQFWMSPAAIAARDWADVDVTLQST